MGKGTTDEQLASIIEMFREMLDDNDLDVWFTAVVPDSGYEGVEIDIQYRDIGIGFHDCGVEFTLKDILDTTILRLTGGK